MVAPATSAHQRAANAHQAAIYRAMTPQQRMEQALRMSEGEYFGEIALLMPTPRTATMKAVAQCDLFVPERSAFARIMQDNPHFAESVVTLARERYHLTISGTDLMHA